MTTDLTGQVAIVTGGAGTLGSQVAAQLLSANASVYRFDLVDGYDTCYKEDWTKFLDDLLGHETAINILVNCAGRLLANPFFQLTPIDINEILTEELSAVITSCQTVGQQMVNQLSGTIINVWRNPISVRFNNTVELSNYGVTILDIPDTHIAGILNLL